MCPDFVPNHLTDERLTDSKTAGELSLRRLTRVVCTANFQHVGLRELGQSVASAASHALGMEMGGMVLAARECFRARSRSVAVADGIASLANHVADVVGVGAKEEVIGANTRRVIAAVQDVESRGDCPEMQLPRDAMGGANAAVTDVQETVSAAVVIAGPRPTAIASVYASPEALLNRLHGTLIFSPVYRIRLGMG
jgi:hypothetical protein